MQNRRQFLRAMSSSGLLLSTGSFPFQIFDHGEITKITILHTNDVHSRIEPFPMDGGRNQGKGGAAKRAKMIADIRAQEPNVLLLDSGDIFQGTPYYNFFGGELEFKLMSEMKYDVATMGNHDFDGGIDGFVRQMPHANFDFVVSNYKVADTALSEHIKPFVIKEQAGIRIGIFGLGIELDGLVADSMCKGVIYQDPIVVAQQTANVLRSDYGCDYIICLSHLGYRYDEHRVSDVILAEATDNIDLILGGHTHTFLKTISKKENKAKKPVFINQAGWGGMLLGRLDLFFENNKKTKCQTCKNLLVD